MRQISRLLDRVKEGPHLMYYVNDAEELANRHLSAHSMPIPPPRVIEGRSSIVELLLSQHLVTPKSRLNMILRIKFCVIVLTVIVLVSVYWRQTMHFAEIHLKWIGDHPSITSMVVMALPVIVSIIGIPMSSIICIGCGYAYYHQFGMLGVAAAALLSEPT